MTARQLIVPGAMPSRDRNGRALPAKLRFYAPNTTNPATVYTSNALSVAHAFPILSDSAGRWPAIWADDANSFDIAWSDQTFDKPITTYAGVTPANDAVLASVALAQAAADTAIANAATDNAVASAASAAAAATSATAAAGSATSAASSATASAGSATAAAGSATAAAASAAGAAAIVGFNPTAVHVTGGGLATGGGDISTDRTITVTKSSQAQAQAGTDDATAMTPVRTADAIQQFAPGAGLEWYGDGSDGNVTISGAVTLARDMYYNNLTPVSGAAVDCRGYRIFVAGTLDLTAAPAGALKANGGAASGSTAGTAGSAVTVGVGAAGVNGGAGDITRGGAGTNGSAGANGGAGGPGGTGGAAVAIASSAGTAGPVTAVVAHRVRASLNTADVGSPSLLGGGASGGSGGGGSGDNDTISGSSAGGSGAGGAVLQIMARFINRGAGTATGALQARGGKGGDGINATGGQAAGGGAGSGGGGGWVYIVCDKLLGTSAANAIDTTGGDGGKGGNGNSGYDGGYGGGSGAGGRLTLAQAVGRSMTDTLSSAAAKPAVANSGVTGGTGATANLAQFGL